MDNVAPFRAWRYALKAGDPALLVAPPYDIIGGDLQSRLYARSRYNVVRVDLGMTLPQDTDCDNRYTRARGQLDEWKRAGILAQDPAPTLTFVEEEFTGPDGKARVRNGFLAALRLHDFSEGVVFPHEQTFSGPKKDRFLLMEATSMSLSPVFLLYDLPGDEITKAWRAERGAEPPATVIYDELGNRTGLWPTTDPKAIEAAERHLRAAKFIIADGHHRYETALHYRDSRRSLNDSHAATPADGADRRTEPAYEYVLAYLSNMADSGLTIYATHRLVSAANMERIAALPRTLAGAFAVEPLSAAEGEREDEDAGRAAAAQRSIERYLATQGRGAFGVWVPTTGQLYGLRLVEPSAVAAVTPGHSRAYQGLDATVLQRLIFEHALGIPSEGPTAERYVSFFKNAGEAFERLERAEFQAGFFMNPTGLEQVREVAFSGERMPQKATFFYPKLPTGLVFLDLSGPL